MKNRISLSLLAGLLIATCVEFRPQPAHSLSCAFSPVLSSVNPDYPLIIGEVQSLDPDGTLKVEVQETLIGSVNKKFLHINAKNFVYWSSPSALPKGSKWALTLIPNPATKAEAEPNEAFDFSISPCFNAPKVLGDTVVGYLLEQRNETMTIQEFRSRVQAIVIWRNCSSVSWRKWFHDFPKVVVRSPRN